MLLAGLTSACGTGPVEPLRPLGDASAPRATTPGAATDPTGTPPAPITPSAPEPAGPTTTAPEPGDGPGRIVADVLDRYDRVLARLHADPAAMNRPGDPVGSELLGELGRVVPAGAVLFDDIRSQLAGRAARGESIPVEDRQLPYVHHGIDADVEGADRVTFTWCSWSPGWCATPPPGQSSTTPSAKGRARVWRSGSTGRGCSRRSTRALSTCFPPVRPTPAPERIGAGRDPPSPSPARCRRGRRRRRVGGDGLRWPVVGGSGRGLHRLIAGHPRRADHHVDHQPDGHPLPRPGNRPEHLLAHAHRHRAVVPVGRPRQRPQPAGRLRRRDARWPTPDRTGPRTSRSRSDEVGSPGRPGPCLPIGSPRLRSWPAA